MGQLILWVSLTVCVLSLFISLDSLAPARSLLGEFLPYSVVLFYTQAKQSAFTFFYKPERIFTKQDLSKYTGEDGGNVYISIVGQVFDVTRGKKHYGPGGGYSFFAGRDGSKAFVSGDFSEKGLTDDLSGLEGSQLLSLEEWKDFYQRDYTYVGKFVGRFYTAEGKPTSALALYEERLQKANAEKKAEEDLRQVLPPCNTQWSEGGHRRVWCTNLSGGIARDWVGVPRQYYQPGKAQSKPRCVCIRNTGPPSDAKDKKQHKNRGDLDNPNLKLYENCDPKADSCVYTKADDQ